MTTGTITPLVRIKVMFSEERCGVCLAGSPGTCTPMTDEARDSQGVGHDWTPVTLAVGEEA